jgi:lincosamide nucleotidyltransferase A/C/D/E
MRTESRKDMDADDVIAFYTELEKLGIEIWLDGGWGVDALLGRQTRPHADLDIFIQEKDVSRLRGLLESRGYREIKLEIARSFNFVLGDSIGREIDVHVFNFDNNGNFTYGTGASAEIFPVAVLAGVGTIEGRTVKCISPEWMVKWHTGYKLRESDYKDVLALCKKFNIEIPAEYIIKE